MKAAMNHQAVRKACDVVGGQIKLASMLGLSITTVNQWVNGKKRISFVKALLIEEATNKNVIVEDIFPSLDISHIRNSPIYDDKNSRSIAFGKELKAHKSHKYVVNAIRDGYLPSPSTLTCLDCGAPAKAYDHRDYNKPLDVEPVCHACNSKRGPAIPFVHVNDR